MSIVDSQEGSTELSQSGTKADNSWVLIYTSMIKEAGYMNNVINS